VEHVRALIVKFIMCTVFLWIILGLFYGVGFGDIVAIGVILTIVAYLLGDLFILPTFGNIAATIADFVLAFIVIWLLGAALIDVPIPLVTASFISALVIAAGEWFFHRYMDNQVIGDKNRKNRPLKEDNVATEFAEENEAQEIGENKDQK